jgi:hypothetical protein
MKKYFISIYKQDYWMQSIVHDFKRLFTESFKKQFV